VAKTVDDLAGLTQTEPILLTKITELGER